jgi:hypothetical protein
MAKCLNCGRRMPAEYDSQICMRCAGEGPGRRAGRFDRARKIGLNRYSMPGGLTRPGENPHDTGPYAFSRPRPRITVMSPFVAALPQRPAVIGIREQLA